MNAKIEKQTQEEQTLPTQRTVRFVIVGVTIVVTIRMILAAIEHNQWREFFVSETAVLATAIALWSLLRDSKSSRKS